MVKPEDLEKNKKAVAKIQAFWNALYIRKNFKQIQVSIHYMHMCMYCAN